MIWCIKRIDVYLAKRRNVVWKHKQEHSLSGTYVHYFLYNVDKEKGQRVISEGNNFPSLFIYFSTHISLA